MQILQKDSWFRKWVVDWVFWYRRPENRKYPTRLDPLEYYPRFRGSSLIEGKTRHEVAFFQTVENRRFEIELYWKRATYFWAFIATTFGGYLAITASDKVSDLGFERFVLICVGFCLSLAWFFTNLGSKTWQRQWENQLDLLEDKVTGPLYKTVHIQETFSVSKINEIISLLFVVIWILLGIWVLKEENFFNSGRSNDGVWAWQRAFPRSGI